MWTAPDFDGHQVDFDELMKRNGIYREQEQEENHCLNCRMQRLAEECNLAADRNRRETAMKNMSQYKVEMPVQDPLVRNKNFDEVALGYTPEMAMEEAARCLGCKHRPCVEGCPVSVQIPDFIARVAEGDFAGAYRVIRQTSALPAVCGRVCPQESQCESKCVRGIKGEPVGIGRLERFVADWARENLPDEEVPAAFNGHRVAVIGAGPAGLTCAGELAKLGYGVTIFEALHTPGGVLSYGIPEFRLPKYIVAKEVEGLQKMGVEIRTNMVIGRVESVDELMDEGYEAVFIGSGAGLPSFMGIEGEALSGVYSANEYLTRVNLMKAYREGYECPSAAAAAPLWWAAAMWPWMQPGVPSAWAQR